MYYYILKVLIDQIQKCWIPKSFFHRNLDKKFEERWVFTRMVLFFSIFLDTCCLYGPAMLSNWWNKNIYSSSFFANPFSDFFWWNFAFGWLYSVLYFVKLAFQRVVDITLHRLCFPLFSANLGKTFEVFSSTFSFFSLVLLLVFECINPMLPVRNNREASEANVRFWECKSDKFLQFQQFLLKILAMKYRKEECCCQKFLLALRRISEWRGCVCAFGVCEMISNCTTQFFDA